MNSSFEKKSTPKPFIHKDQALIVGIALNSEGSRLYICPLCPHTAQTRSSFCRHGRDHHGFPTGAVIFYSPADMKPNTAVLVPCKQLFFVFILTHLSLFMAAAVGAPEGVPPVPAPVVDELVAVPATPLLEAAPQVAKVALPHKRKFFLFLSHAHTCLHSCPGVTLMAGVRYLESNDVLQSMGLCWHTALHRFQCLRCEISISKEDAVGHIS